MPNLIQQIDEAILFFMQNHLKNPALDRSMVLITSLGNAGLLWIIIAFLLLFIKRYQKCGLLLICALAFSKFIGDDLLKPLLGRVRPCNKFTEIAILIHTPHSPSFPSGHTAVGFACATILYHCNRRLGICGFVVAALIALSRMYLFVHYPTDILGGILLGILTSRILLTCIKSLD